jgi:putative ABC transport system ATP-binding protein
MSPPLFRAEGLSRRLEGRPLWQGITFSLEVGDRLALVGPTGTGKTLLLRSLVLLDPLGSGRLELRGRSPAEWTLPIWRSRTLLLQQRPVALAGTVDDNLRAALAFASHRGRPYRREWVLARLRELGRDESFLAQEAQRLSGGELQLMALLRALQLDPDVLLLDEPTASLDAATTSRVEALVEAWLAGGERACLLTSHDAAQIERFCPRRLALTP